MNKHLIMAVLCCWMAWGTLYAQTSRKELRKERREEMKARIDSAVTAHYFSGKYDTTYISRPVQPLMVKLRGNVSGSLFDIKEKGGDGHIKLNTDTKVTASIGLNWRGISVGAALNPARLSGRNKDYEFNINAYMNRFGVDVVYQDTRTLSGNANWDGESGYLERGTLRMKMFNVNGYYAFNGRRFSYPAAFTQSYFQRRSAGSWLVGFSYMGGTLKTTDEKPEGMPDYRIYVGHFGVGGGYGYNWVPFRRKLLLHISALPTIIIGNYSNVRVDDERVDMNTKFPNFILTERAAIVYNFNEKYFAAATLVVTNSIVGGDDVDIDFAKWRARACFGIRLGGKKQ